MREVNESSHPVAQKFGRVDTQAGTEAEPVRGVALRRCAATKLDAFGRAT